MDSLKDIPQLIRLNKVLEMIHWKIFLVERSEIRTLPKAGLRWSKDTCLAFGGHR